MPNASVDHTKIASPHTEKAPVRKYNAASRADARLAFLQMRKAGHSIAQCGRRIGVSNGTAMRWENLAKGGKLLAEDALRLRLSRDEAVAILAPHPRATGAGAPPERPIRSIMSPAQDAEAQALAGDAEMSAVEATVETPPAAPPASVNESDQPPAKNFPKISAQTESAPK